MTKTSKLWIMLMVISLLVGGLGYVPQQVSAATNLAYGRPVTVSSTENSSFPGSNAVDANGNTRWSSAASDSQYIIIDLGNSQQISNVILKWASAYAKSFQIQVSNDNSKWLTVYSNYSSTGGTSNISFAPTKARYVKMYAFARATSAGYSLYEFEIYGSTSQVGVLDYLKGISGKSTVLGIHNREPNANPAVQTNQLHNITGRYPALWSGDFLFSSSDVSNRWTMINEAKKQWDNGAIVNIMLHVVPPTQSEPGNWDGGVVSKLSDAQWSDLITDGGTLNKAWKARLDNYAQYLQYLKDNNVTVLFRPFHEMNQGVFWWGGRPGTNGTAALYRLTHDYLTNTKGLTNLVWVWDMQDLDLNWSAYNPGSNYFDVFALDVYNPDGFTTVKYNTALSVANGKPIAIGECDKLPTATVLAEQPKWAFAISWAELTFGSNTNDQIKALYNASNTVTRDLLPVLK